MNTQREHIKYLYFQIQSILPIKGKGQNLGFCKNMVLTAHEQFFSVPCKYFVTKLNFVLVDAYARPASLGWAEH